MAQGRDQDLMHYEEMAQEALRGVIKAALQRAAGPGGMPGQHHFYITFRTHAAGVSIPSELSERYPEEMTIVLQHQFWELTPGDSGFSVMLSFGGQPKKLAIPYRAVSRFHDPSVQFLLQFEPAADEAEAPAASSEPVQLRPKTEADSNVEALPSPPAPAEAEGGPEKPDEPKIVSLDQFRKK